MRQCKLLMLKKKQMLLWSIMYLNAFIDSFFFRFNLLSHFSVLYTFLFSKPFWNNQAFLEKLGFLVNKSLCSLKQVQENVHLVILYSLACDLPHHAPNQIDFGKKNVEINSDIAIFSVFFSGSIIRLEKITSCPWNDCE